MQTLMQTLSLANTTVASTLCYQEHNLKYCLSNDYLFLQKMCNVCVMKTDVMCKLKFKTLELP